MYIYCLVFKNMLLNNRNESKTNVKWFQIFHKILDCEAPAVAEAQVLLNRILKRQFYQDVVTIDVLRNSQLRGMNDTQVWKDLGKLPYSTGLVKIILQLIGPKIIWFLFKYFITKSKTL